MPALEPEIETNVATVPEIEPKLYYADKAIFLIDWIAEGTDGLLYLFPAVAGGWLRRVQYAGPCAELAPVRPEKARTIMWFVYGDVGPVTIVSG